MKILNLKSTLIFCICFQILLCKGLYGQVPISLYFKNIYGFGKSLYLDEDYMRAISEFKKALSINSFAGLNCSDSLNYLIGISYSKISDYELSNKYLAHVSGYNTKISEKAIFQTGKNYFLSGNYNPAIFFHRNIRSGDLSREYSEKLTLLLASSYLMLNDAESASRELATAALTDSELFIYSTELGNFRPKSAFVAGSLSAMVPGAGKFYTNNLEHGLISMFAIGLIGFRTVIEYNRNGLNSPGFIAFGLIFLVTYTGNIIGSAISAKHYNERHYNDLHFKVINFVNEFD